MPTRTSAAPIEVRSPREAEQNGRPSDHSDHTHSRRPEDERDEHPALTVAAECAGDDETRDDCGGAEPRCPAPAHSADERGDEPTSGQQSHTLR